MSESAKETSQQGPMTTEARRKHTWFPFIVPLTFPLAIPLCWPGVLVLATYLQRGEPIILDSNEWVCTHKTVAPAGMAIVDVCDQYTRKR